MVLLSFWKEKEKIDTEGGEVSAVFCRIVSALNLKQEVVPVNIPLSEKAKENQIQDLESQGVSLKIKIKNLKNELINIQEKEKKLIYRREEINKKILSLEEKNSLLNSARERLKNLQIPKTNLTRKEKIEIILKEHPELQGLEDDLPNSIREEYNL